MLDLTKQLKSRIDLAAGEIAHAVAHLVSAETADGVKAEFLQALREKGESAAEIAGFAKELLARAVDPGLNPAVLPGPMLDVCGTGGDRMELFNVSTTSMFVLAAGGVRRPASTRCALRSRRVPIPHPLLLASSASQGFEARIACHNRKPVNN